MFNTSTLPNYLPLPLPNYLPPTITVQPITTNTLSTTSQIVQPVTTTNILSTTSQIVQPVTTTNILSITSQIVQPITANILSTTFQPMTTPNVQPNTLINNCVNSFNDARSVYQQIEQQQYGSIAGTLSWDNNLANTCRIVAQQCAANGQLTHFNVGPGGQILATTTTCSEARVLWVENELQFINEPFNARNGHAKIILNPRNTFVGCYSSQGVIPCICCNFG